MLVRELVHEEPVVHVVVQQLVPERCESQLFVLFCADNLTLVLCHVGMLLSAGHHAVQRPEELALLRELQVEVLGEAAVVTTAGHHEEAGALGGEARRISELINSFLALLWVHNNLII